MMKNSYLSRCYCYLLILVCCFPHSSASIPSVGGGISRRILHQPLFPATSSPPPSGPPPADTSASFPFFPEVPAQASSTPPDQQQQTPPVTSSDANGTLPIPTATTAQQAKPVKNAAIAVSVALVTLGMLSGLAFFICRHRAKHSTRRESEKFVAEGDQSRRFDDDELVRNPRNPRNSLRAPPPPPLQQQQTSNFLYMGTVEPSRSLSSEMNGTATTTTVSVSTTKASSMKRSDRYRPSPELHPLPPLPKPPVASITPFDKYHPHHNPRLSRPLQATAVVPRPELETSESQTSSSSGDEESNGTAFYTPAGSAMSNDDGFYAPISGSRHRHSKSNGSGRSSNLKSGNGGNGSSSVPHSKRTSPKSRFTSSVSSPEMKHVIIPSIKKPPSEDNPPSPPPRDDDDVQVASSHLSNRPKFAAPPPPPNMAILQSLNNNPPCKPTVPPPPPPPPPPPAPSSSIPTPRKVGRSLSPEKTRSSSTTWTPSSTGSSKTNAAKSVEKSTGSGGLMSSGKMDADDENEGTKPKLKALHWDKVRATSDRATVWDQLKSSSFQLNEDMMESLFGCNSANSAQKEQLQNATRKSVLPAPVEKEMRVLDPKKSQNIAILLRALNVTKDEVSEALLHGNPEGLGADLLETLVKMAPTKEEEIKLRDYNGDISKLGSAERFLKAILDVPFAFKRVEAMLYRANFETEVSYLKRSFQTLEVASEELKNSRLFFKLLEAVLKTGNRMNVGTNRGDAKSFKLDTLLKLVDIKGTDGKTTLLHFVVQEMIRSEGGAHPELVHDNKLAPTTMKDEEFRKQGLVVVSSLGRELINVKKAAGMDSDVLSSYVAKLETGLEKVRSVLQHQKTGNFFQSMKLFLGDAEDEIETIKVAESRALALVKEVTEYFHGDTAKEEAHPLRIFMVVRDFLSILDHVCKEVGQMQDRTLVGSARSFRIAPSASLPVLNRYNVRQDRMSSDDDSSSSP